MNEKSTFPSPSDQETGKVTEREIILSYAIPSEPPKRRKAGPALTALIMAVPLVLLVQFVDLGQSRGIFIHVWGGYLFTFGFDRSHAGMVLDQPTIGKWYIIFTVLSAAALPYVALAKWISARRTRLAYWAFAAPAIAVSLLLLTILTLPFWWLVQYIYEMGFTTRRIQALAYALGWYGLILVFLRWALRPPSAVKAPSAPPDQLTKGQPTRQLTTDN